MVSFRGVAVVRGGELFTPFRACLLLVAIVCTRAISIDDGFGAVEGVQTLDAALRNTAALEVSCLSRYEHTNDKTVGLALGAFPTSIPREATILARTV